MMILFLAVLFYLPLPSLSQSGEMAVCRMLNGTTYAYLQGHWLSTPNRPKSFPCHCAGHDTPDTFKDKDCADRESPILPTDSPLGYKLSRPQFPQLMGHGCSCQIQHMTELSGANVSSLPSAVNDRSSLALATSFSLPAEQYTWTPFNCTMPSIIDVASASAFCAHLARGDKSILMVGDSTMQQSAASLISTLIHFNASLSCLERLKFELSDYITYHPDESRGNHFMFLTRKHLPTVLILGSSAHYDVSAKLHEAHSQEYMDSFVPKLRRDIAFLRDTPSICPKHILFKTQNPGHLECNNATSPSITVPSADPHMYTSHSHSTHQNNKTTTNATDRYSWRSHTYTDAHVVRFFLSNEQRELWQQRGRARLGILDMSPLYMRADAHALRDCLHFCTPGPLDLLGQYLLAALGNGELD